MIKILQLTSREGDTDMNEPKLLGDRVEQVIDSLGGKQIAKAIERITKRPCNCARRKEALNRLHKSLTNR